MIRLEFTPEQRDAIFRASGINKPSWEVEKHHLVALSLLASSSNLETLPFGPSMVGQILSLRASGREGALLEIILTPEQREELQRHTGVSFRSLTIAADDLTVGFREPWSNAEPFNLGNRFRIVPESHAAEPAPGRLVLRLPYAKAGASRVFGTGRHVTTGIAVELIEDYVRPQDRVLDFGTGSGILAVAAAMLGAREVVAIDRDRECVDVAEACVRINSLQSSISVREADHAPRGGAFDLIVANLFTNILLQKPEELRAALRPGGSLIATGIVIARGPEVVQAMSASGFSLIEERTRGEWKALAFRAS